jgi:hypothetical protein
VGDAVRADIRLDAGGVSAGGTPSDVTPAAPTRRFRRSISTPRRSPEAFAVCGAVPRPRDPGRRATGHRSDCSIVSSTPPTRTRRASAHIAQSGVETALVHLLAPLRAPHRSHRSCGCGRGIAAARGLWAALQAIMRLAHAGCEAGDLRVTPFNGRLFAPDRADLVDRPRGRRRRGRSRPARDASLARVLLALTTRPGGAGGRERISYGDLGVEQLGAVYERVLDYEPDPTQTDVQLRATGRRKATGTFYTPRSLTDFLVRRTLHPLVRDATPEEILSLRVLDAAMGSGAFLVSACRYLASAYERALMRSGAARAHDVTDGDRADWRRLVAQRCLYGVDVNPMAVQLGRLSL